MPGVTIGFGSVIGAGSIVTKSIPSYSIAVGNPAKVIKKYNITSNIWESVNLQEC
jgi:acetyltransferase-like isoleucine patch superfamily enzyme